MKAELADIYKNARGVLILMILNLFLGLVLLIVAMVNINPNTAVVKIGYGDIGGYQDGTWVGMLAFPMLAVLFGGLHSALSVRVYRRRGKTMAKFFLFLTSFLIIGTFVVLVRLLNEG